MKQMIHSIALAIILFASFKSIAQVPPAGISYQAIARTAGGDELEEVAILVRIGIISATVNGPLEYQEVHTLVTNQFGLFTLVVGEGANTGGNVSSLSAINWASAPHFMRVEIDPPGFSGYELMGTSQLLSVPYAFHAGTVENVVEQDGDTDNETIDNFTLTGTQLNITEAGDQYVVDLATLLADDADSNPANETITSIALNGQSLDITEAGTTHSVSLASLDNGWTVEPGKVYNNTDKIGVGTAFPQSTLHVSGSMSLFVTTVSGGSVITANANNNVFICNVDNGSSTINLPAANTCQGRVYTIKRYASNTANYVNDIFVLPAGGDNIDGQLQYVMASVYEQFATVISDGNDWWIINAYQNDN